MPKRIIISGGGTGGHIFPAVSIGSEIRKREADAEILFVGAKGGMELDLVPRYDFPIEAVWISGIQRQLTLKNIGKNLLFPIKLFTSLQQSRKIIRQFKPQIVIGVGGYASGPLGRVAGKQGIPLVICEQNAYPGLTNKWLAKYAAKILVGNADAQKYFDASKSIVTGNPIRTFEPIEQQKAAEMMGIDAAKPVLLSLGGSLGALRINQALEAQLDQLIEADVQLLWQCGKRYYDELKQRVPTHPNIKLQAFINDMGAAYSAADLVISRAGASTLSELIELSKPALLVPSPNVAEDHQTKNALSLSEKGAAVLIKDQDAVETLVPEAIRILQSANELQQLQEGIQAFPKHDAATEIVDEIFKLIES